MCLDKSAREELLVLSMLHIYSTPQKLFFDFPSESLECSQCLTPRVLSRTSWAQSGWGRLAGRSCPLRPIRISLGSLWITLLWNTPSAQQFPAQDSPGNEKREVLHPQHPIRWLPLSNTCDPFSKSVYFQSLIATNESGVSGDSLIF